jgi:glyoxylase-like metal-dependent hydrolase (beta-lactamase superfamily II)
MKMEKLQAGKDSFFAFHIGSMEVTVLSDGILNVPLANFPEAGSDRAAEILGRGIVTGVPVQVNAYLVRARADTILLDAGSGNSLTAEGSRLLENLAVIGIAPDDIGRVVLSHMHVDHIGGLVDGDVPVFPEAQILVAVAELGYWTQPGFPEQAPERQRKSAHVAQQMLAAYREKVSTFVPGEEIACGIRTVPLPGHTPGHSGFLLEDEGDALRIWGDIVHSAAFQFAQPDWHYAAHVDRQAALEYSYQ